ILPVLPHFRATVRSAPPSCARVAPSSADVLPEAAGFLPPAEMSSRGTGSSNPSPSSGESYANLTSSIEVPKILPSGGQRWHAPVVKLGAQFVRLGGDDGEAASPAGERQVSHNPAMRISRVDHR